MTGGGLRVEDSSSEYGDDGLTFDEVADSRCGSSRRACERSGSGKWSGAGPKTG